ncbi:uncharacterized protein DMAD_00367 [Drosophila madeirensis]|uniref:Uncharacterized protein n=1 Tax=Drosophila madeirensis TaxID=30013 RepID=A0AAU9FX95_DROMD
MKTDFKPDTFVLSEAVAKLALDMAPIDVEEEDDVDIPEISPENEPFEDSDDSDDNYFLNLCILNSSSDEEDFEYPEEQEDQSDMSESENELSADAESDVAQ